MKRSVFTLSLLLIVFIASSSSAQKAYRCGPDGSTFQQTPCVQGQAIDVSDRRSATQRRDAKGIARREAQLAEKLERDRLKRDAAIVPAMATGINGQPMPQAASASSASKANNKKKPGVRRTRSKP